MNHMGPPAGPGDKVKSMAQKLEGAYNLELPGMLLCMDPVAVFLAPRAAHFTEIKKSTTTVFKFS